jgi:hypothetical protein
MRTLLGLILLLTLGTTAEAQTASSAHHKRTVSLDAVLSCASDHMLDTVFQTNYLTALKLGTAGMAWTRREHSTDEDYILLAANGFQTKIVDDRHFLIIPSEVSGEITKDTKDNFCHDDLVATYENTHSGPSQIETRADNWFLNPNQVLAHADQYSFKSGVFTDSSEVYLTATKGRVDIQFICKPEGLVFYRAFYNAKE